MTDFHKPGQPGQAAALPKGFAQSINLRSIRIDGGTQSRAELNHATVDEYSEAMAEGTGALDGLPALASAALQQSDKAAGMAVVSWRRWRSMSSRWRSM